LNLRESNNKQDKGSKSSGGFDRGSRTADGWIGTSELGCSSSCSRAASCGGSFVGGARGRESLCGGEEGVKAGRGVIVTGLSSLMKKRKRCCYRLSVLESVLEFGRAGRGPGRDARAVVCGEGGPGLDGLQRCRCFNLGNL
jgi:hypothetical protein